jgi:tRNA pseudouridine32 synthase / 23S rRNA pseudouridine746 synthase
MPPSAAASHGPVPRILFRNAQLAVIEKPANVSLLADRSGAPCLWTQLPDLLGTKPYLVHRLDKGTSGVLLVALESGTQAALTRAFNRREIRKFYVAWVAGRLETHGTLTIDLPLKPGRKSRYRVAGARSDIARTPRGWVLSGPAAGGLESLTRLRTLRSADARSLVLLAPRTGRTHQLRVHLAWIGHPILGDTLYGQPGTPAQDAPRLELHCHCLAVPGYGTFRSPRPDGWLARDRQRAR